MIDFSMPNKARKTISTDDVKAILESNGEMPARGIGIALGVTGKAARYHLGKLSRDGDVSYREVPSKRKSTPTKLWSLVSLDL